MSIVCEFPCNVLPPFQKMQLSLPKNSNNFKFDQIYIKNY